VSYENIRYEVAQNGVATVTLDDPDTRNAPGNQTLDELITAFEARDDEAVRCVVLASSLTAAQAHAAGIVNKVVPAAGFDAAVSDWAGKLAAKSPLMMRLGKDAMFRQMDMPLSSTRSTTCTTTSRSRSRPTTPSRA
jgi:enoyl-CoA hydratase/carnithine racemase